MENAVKRKQIRLKDYDYSQDGAYFITICSTEKKYLFATICRGGALLLPMGQLIGEEINNLPQRYGVTVDKFIIMPNHVHMIVFLQREAQVTTPTITDMICGLKSITTKRANQSDQVVGRKIWQRSFYDHVIRNQQSYNDIWKYIDENPLAWNTDPLNQHVKQIKII